MIHNYSVLYKSLAEDLFLQQVFLIERNAETLISYLFQMFYQQT